MKKHISIFAALLTIVACQIEELPIGDAMGKGKEFEAYTESDGTRTSMDSDFNVIWSEGDEVSIFAGSTVNQHYKTTSFGTTSTSMEVVNGGGFVAGSVIPCNVAVYPYSPSIGIKKSGNGYLLNNVTIPSEQTYCASSFGNGTAPMVAVTSGTSDMVLKFKNAFGGINLQLTGTDTIKAITFKGNNGEVISGTADVSVSYSSVPSITMTGDGSTVTLNCGTGVKLDEVNPTSFYIVLPPVVLSQGFTAVVTDTEGKSMTMTSTKTQTIRRNTMLNMPEIKYEATEDEMRMPLTLKAKGNASVELRQIGNAYALNLEYKINDNGWCEYTIGDRLLLDTGDRVSFRNQFDNSGFSDSIRNYFKFVFSGGEIEAYGNIESLIDKSMEQYSCSGCFAYLFKDCTNLTRAPLLPARTMSPEGYYGMFDNCRKLSAAPELPATQLARDCYLGMFINCINLQNVFDLPAEDLADYCYSAMFFGCISLTTAPKLPALQLKRGCYSQMFMGCATLSIPPVLPASELAEGCYESMFQGCSSLSTTPVLDALQMKNQCYKSMFWGCESIGECPKLPAKNLAEECYDSMFWGCSKITDAPELGAIVLADGCYSSMFGECFELSTAPVLPADILEKNCYAYMFDSCSKINYVKMLATDVSRANCLTGWLSGVSSTGTLVKNQHASWENDGVVPKGWIVVCE